MVPKPDILTAGPLPRQAFGVQGWVVLTWVQVLTSPPSSQATLHVLLLVSEQLLHHLENRNSADFKKGSGIIHNIVVSEHVCLINKLYCSL